MKDLSSPSDENPAPEIVQRAKEAKLMHAPDGLFYVQDIADSEKDRFRQLQLDQAAGDLVLVPDIRKPLQKIRCLEMPAREVHRDGKHRRALAPGRPASMAQTSSNTYRSSRQMSPLRSNTGIKSEG